MKCFMKQLIIILISSLLLLPLGLQAQYDRQPFSGSNPPALHLPCEELPNGSYFNRTGPLDPPPNTNEGSGSWVGHCTIEDASWFLLLMVIGYGVARKKSCTRITQINTD